MAAMNNASKKAAGGDKDEGNVLNINDLFLANGKKKKYSGC